jgi:hypothetical protein
MVKAGIFEEHNKQDVKLNLTIKNIIAAIPLAFINFVGSILSMKYVDQYLFLKKIVWDVDISFWELCQFVLLVLHWHLLDFMLMDIYIKVYF